MLNSNSTEPVPLNKLPKDTAKFFMKAPDNNILEYILSKKVILVEGDAEFILLDAFYKNVAGENLEDSDIHTISVGGTSFKRYLDITKLLGIKTAVIRDNDTNHQANIREIQKDEEIFKYWCYAWTLDSEKFERYVSKIKSNKAHFIFENEAWKINEK